MHEESGSLPPEPNCMPDQLSDAAASSSHERVTGWRLSKGRGPQLDFAFGNFLTRTGVAKERSQVQAISFASAKATAAATPPITTVCAALRNANRCDRWRSGGSRLRAGKTDCLNLTSLFRDASSCQKIPECEVELRSSSFA